MVLEGHVKRYHKDVLAILTSEARESITSLRAIHDAIMASVSNQTCSVSSYRIAVVSECRSHLRALKEWHKVREPPHRIRTADMVRDIYHVMERSWFGCWDVSWSLKVHREPDHTTRHDGADEADNTNNGRVVGGRGDKNKSLQDPGERVALLDVGNAGAETDIHRDDISCSSSVDVESELHFISCPVGGKRDCGGSS